MVLIKKKQLTYFRGVAPSTPQKFDEWLPKMLLFLKTYLLSNMASSFWRLSMLNQISGGYVQLVSWQNLGENPVGFQNPNPHLIFPNKTSLITGIN